MGLCAEPQQRHVSRPDPAHVEREGGLLGIRIGEASHPGLHGSRTTLRKRMEKKQDQFLLQPPYQFCSRSSRTSSKTSCQFEHHDQPREEHRLHGNRTDRRRPSSPHRHCVHQTDPYLWFMQVLKVRHLPRKGIYAGTESATPKAAASNQSTFVAKASADIYACTESATPATQIEPEVLKVPRLPHKRQRSQVGPLSSLSLCRHAGTESVTCHAKSRGVKSVHFRQASAGIYAGTESATPATQRHLCRYWKCHLKGSGVKSVHFRRQSFRRHLCMYWKCHTCHCHLPRKKPRRQISPLSSPSYVCRYWKCHASHAKAAASNQSTLVTKLPQTLRHPAPNLAYQCRTMATRHYVAYLKMHFSQGSVANFDPGAFQGHKNLKWKEMKA